jgi:hypothetical protein
MCGCVHYGPRTIAQDRFDYSTAIGDSWKNQTLLNIVKLRYMDLPVFVDVASIVEGYTLETSASAGGGVNWPSSGAPGGQASAAVGGRYTERPTITYVPMTGEKFLRGLLTPIDPKQIFFMLQSGYAADFILGLTVESMNGVRNRSAAGGEVREADPAFGRVLELMREVQVSGAIGMRVQQTDGRETGILIFRREDVSPEVAAKSAEIRQLLHLSQDAQQFSLNYSPMRGTDTELAVNSRSMMQIMQAFASYIEVPQDHLEQRRATPTFSGNGVSVDNQASVKIYSGSDRPADAFAAIQYRGTWYWVDDRDLKTKRAFSAIMFFFTLADTGSGDKLPLITIPAQ